jgi:hypothetical protein
VSCAILGIVKPLRLPSFPYSCNTFFIAVFSLLSQVILHNFGFASRCSGRQIGSVSQMVQIWSVFKAAGVSTSPREDS